jgi:homoserine O-acetyltransferase
LHKMWEKFPFDAILEEYDILCINSLGSCHGTLGPDSINPDTHKPYLDNFPQITIQNTINFAVEVLKKLMLKKFDLVMGCSLGGMQVLDMFLRFSEFGKKFISVCGSPLSLMAKLINLAQCNIIESGIKQMLPEDLLRQRMSLAWFFFRLSCTTENALIILGKKQASLENYFVNDGDEYKDTFSPYSYSLYMRMLAEFELESSIFSANIKTDRREILLVDIRGDSFTPPKNIEEIYNRLKQKNYKVRKKTFETNYGHEAWILDGKKFYEFIKNDFVHEHAALFANSTS